MNRIKSHFQRLRYSFDINSCHIKYLEWCWILLRKLKTEMSLTYIFEAKMYVACYLIDHIRQISKIPGQI